MPSKKNVSAGKMSPDEKTAVKLEIGRIPEVILDNTDRNRTSPFAFTGNKFEFRAVGSTANCAVPMTVLNTIVAEQLNMFKVAVDKRIADGDKKDEALLKEIQALIKQSKSIRFEGNGYGQEWVEGGHQARSVQLARYAQRTRCLGPQRGRGFV